MVRAHNSYNRLFDKICGFWPDFKFSSIELKFKPQFKLFLKHHFNYQLNFSLDIPAKQIRLHARSNFSFVYSECLQRVFVEKTFAENGRLVSKLLHVFQRSGFELDFVELQRV